MNEQEVTKELERFTKYRDQMMSDYENHRWLIDEQQSLLDTILRLNEAIRNCRRDLRMFKSGTWK